MWNTAFSLVVYISTITHFQVVCSSESVPSLLSQHIQTDDFLHSHSLYNHYTTHTKEANLTTLVYVTPWNRHGYQVANMFTGKFDLISPVWFDVLARKKAYTVTGVQNIDKEWLKQLKIANEHLKVVPRFTFNEWKAADYLETFTDPDKMDTCLKKIVHVLELYGFDGAVIEIWSQFVGTTEPLLLKFVQRTSKIMREVNKLVVLVIPPPMYFNEIPGRFTQNHFDQLHPYVDYFSLMTYDYSPPGKPGPNSPIEWVEKCVELLVPSGSDDEMKKRAQILTGLNFYGIDHVSDVQTGDFILGPRFVEVIDVVRPEFNWDAESAEHFVNFRDHGGHEHVIYYPTTLSIARRIDLAQSLGTGISIWEIGQGLDSFYSFI